MYLACICHFTLLENLACYYVAKIYIAFTRIFQGWRSFKKKTFPLYAELEKLYGGNFFNILFHVQTACIVLLVCLLFCNSSPHTHVRCFEASKAATSLRFCEIRVNGSLFP